MKKIKVIVSAILRGAVILAPGAAFAWWAWGKVPALFSILAAAGLETLWLLAFSFLTVAVTAYRDNRRKAKHSTAS